MADVVNSILDFCGWVTPETIAQLVENIVRVGIGLGLILFIFKGVFRLANIHNLI